MWYKLNKAAEKWNEKEVIAIFEDTADWIESNPDVMLIVDVDIYMLREKGVSHQLRYVWLNKIYKDNKCICTLWEYIQKVTESRVTKDTQKILRPNIQALVMQTKHGYREKHDHSVGGQPENPLQVQEVEKMTIEQQLRALNDKLHKGKNK